LRSGHVSIRRGKESRTDGRLERPHQYENAYRKGGKGSRRAGVGGRPSPRWEEVQPFGPGRVPGQKEGSDMPGLRTPVSGRRGGWSPSNEKKGKSPDFPGTLNPPVVGCGRMTGWPGARGKERGKEY